MLIISMFSFDTLKIEFSFPSNSSSYMTRGLLRSKPKTNTSNE